MARKGTQERSAKYWKVKYHQANNKLLINQSVKRTEGFQSIANNVVKWGGVLGCTYLIMSGLPDVLVPISGKQTEFMFGAIMDTGGGFKSIAFVALCVSNLISWFAYRFKKEEAKGYIEEVGILRDKLDTASLSHRSSSGIKSDGTTRENEK
jgi:hypothetical protein